MPHASSPITFPSSSPPTGSKRAKPHDHPTRAAPPPRTQGGFVLDDDDSDPDEEVGTEPPTKRQALRVESSLAPVVAPTVVGPDTEPVTLEPSVPHSTARLAASDFLASLSSSTPDGLACLIRGRSTSAFEAKTCAGKSVNIQRRQPTTEVSYQNLVAARSKTKEGRAKRAYYGIEIHELIDAVAKERASETPSPASAAATAASSDAPLQSVEASRPTGRKQRSGMLWTEKYRARRFMDLCGDDGTNRTVLRWLKRWDPIVFPGATRARPATARRPGAKPQDGAASEEKPHRKILMLTGPPGLGKTTLAHVCARQAGYEVLEINASDDRSRDVVRNRIRTSLGTETVKAVANSKTLTAATTESEQRPKVARPVCVVVDEVDGVVTGSGASGEGGFVKALIDLVLLDQKNSSATGGSGGQQQGGSRKKRKGDDFRQMRPLILVCNDVYHPSLRPLRQSGLAEVVHVGKPTFDAVVARLKNVFEREGIPCDKDAARRLCETAWGLATGADAKRGAEGATEGDLRGVMVVGEWVAGRFRAAVPRGSSERLTRQWLEQNILADLVAGAGGAKGLGRGGFREIVSRIFQEGAGFPRQASSGLGNLGGAGAGEKVFQEEQPLAQLGFSEMRKRYAMEQLRHMVDMSGDADRIMTEVLGEYPLRDFNDDSFLTKPCAAYDWMHFLDACSSRVYGTQDWELAAYLSQPVLACHHLFASPVRHRPAAASAADDATAQQQPPIPFTGPRAEYAAREAEKANRAALQALQAQLSPTLVRSFRSAEDVATDLLPWLVRLVAPDVKPVVVGGGGDNKGTASVRREAEKVMVRRAAEVLAEVGVALQRGRIESESAGRGPQWVYRMEPDLDALALFETAANTLAAAQAPTRYAVRQVLDQELHKTLAARDNAARQARFQAGTACGADGSSARPFAHDNSNDDKENRDRAKMEQAAGAEWGVKRDFFGRVVQVRPLAERDGNAAAGAGESRAGPELRDSNRVWVTFHEGLNNAVRKPISLAEFMKGF